MASATSALRSVLADPGFLWAWGTTCLLSLAVLAWDLARRNRQLGHWMKLVWVLTTVYSGAAGLAVYFYAGRRQIPRDSTARRAFRSVAHCYSGCGAGEVLGVLLSVGLLAAGQVVAGLLTFALAYAFGIGLTLGPLLQEGEPPGQALRDAVVSESASIVVMEAVAISVDFWLAGSATIRDTLFWSSLIVSLSAGLLAAHPVNVLLLRWGVKEGMMSPKEAGAP